MSFLAVNHNNNTTKLCHQRNLPCRLIIADLESTTRSSIMLSCHLPVSTTDLSMLYVCTIYFVKSRLHCCSIVCLCTHQTGKHELQWKSPTLQWILTAKFACLPCSSVKVNLSALLAAIALAVGVCLVIADSLHTYLICLKEYNFL